VGGVTTGYGYDACNQLSSLSGPTSADYVYNGDGLRVNKTVGTTTTDYTWDQTGLGQVLSDGNEYVRGLGLINQITSGTLTYVESDGLGSTRLLTDGSGSVVGTRGYDAFGATRDQTGVQLPFTYTGEQVDPESGLVYLRNRYLDPATGRFLTPDPLGFLGSGVNLYAYVANSPGSATDPAGLDCDLCSEIGPASGAAGRSAVWRNAAVSGG
jgi:RHS repeat-associated protein